MNVETGEIVTTEFTLELPESEKKKYKELPNTTYVRPGDKVGRNDFCPCMSGKKFKKCCMEIHQETERELNKLLRR